MKKTNNLTKLALRIANNLDNLNCGYQNSLEFDTFYEFVLANGWILKEKLTKFTSQDVSEISMVFERETDRVTEVFTMNLIVKDFSEYRNGYKLKHYKLMNANLYTRWSGVDIVMDFSAFTLKMLEYLA